MTQMVLDIDHEDIQHLGYIERRPVPLRNPSHPVGHTERGLPIWRPLWADNQWFATWVAAADLVRARHMRRLRLAHMVLCKGRDERDPTSSRHIDWRDSLATMRDLWDHFEVAA